MNENCCQGLSDAECAKLMPCPDDQVYPQPTTLKENAVMMNELFVNLLDAGFTEHQALHIITQSCCPRED